MGNYDDWINYVNEKIDEHEEWIKTREKDLSMENMRLRRLLDATLQRLGESESVLRPELGSDTKDTDLGTAGPLAFSSSVRTSG